MPILTNGLLTLSTSKTSRKKCDEAQPVCSRCAQRDLDCIYTIRRRHTHTFRTTYAHESPSTPRNDSIGSLTGPSNDFSGLVDPSFASPFPMGQQWPFAPGSGWPQIEGTGSASEDLAGSLRFIESAFPRVSHLSPNSATGSEPLLSAEAGNNLSNFNIETEPPNGVSQELWRHEQSYLKAFQDDFWPVIARKDEDPSSAKLHFTQLALYEPLRHAIIAVVSAWRAQTDVSSNAQQRPLDEGIRYHSKAVRGLKISIGRQDKSSWNSIIACTFCLLFYELLRDDSSTTPAHHLLGSLHLLKVDRNAGLNSTSTFHHKVRVSEIVPDCCS